jgi:hypothetical protein
MLDAIQSISGVMETSLEGERDVMMEILRQWMEFVEIKVEEERWRCVGTALFRA